MKESVHEVKGAFWVLVVDIREHLTRIFILDSNNFVTCAESTVFCQQIRNQIDFLKNQEENPTP